MSGPERKTGLIVVAMKDLHVLKMYILLYTQLYLQLYKLLYASLFIKVHVSVLG